MLLNSGFTRQRISQKIIRNLVTRLEHFRQPCPRKKVKELGFKVYRIIFMAGAPKY